VAANRIDITYFTDPLCCWSWALEPQWRKLVFQFKDHLSWRYCLGGLLPSWRVFADNINSVSRPSQMGPVWMHAEKISGMPMAHKIWTVDPPSSSFPACVATKCAFLQSHRHGELYLRKAREFCHLKNKNISNSIILYDIAEELSKDDQTFKLDRFHEDFQGTEGQRSFRLDWEETKRMDINRFPTLLLKKEGKGTILISGYKPFDTLLNALYYLDPEFQGIPFNRSVSEYRTFWGGVIPREELEFKKDPEIHVSNP
jgi:putative protein-disulfide isomerase